MNYACDDAATISARVEELRKERDAYRDVSSSAIEVPPAPPRAADDAGIIHSRLLELRAEAGRAVVGAPPAPEQSCDDCCG